MCVLALTSRSLNTSTGSSLLSSTRPPPLALTECRYLSSQQPVYILPYVISPDKSSPSLIQHLYHYKMSQSHGLLLECLLYQRLFILYSSAKHSTNSSGWLGNKLHEQSSYILYLISISYYTMSSNDSQ